MFGSLKPVLTKTTQEGIVMAANELTSATDLDEVVGMLLATALIGLNAVLWSFILAQSLWSISY